MQEGLSDMSVMLRFAGINGVAFMSNETVNLNFRRLLN